MNTELWRIIEKRWMTIQNELGGKVSSHDWHRLGFKNAHACSQWLYSQRRNRMLVKYREVGNRFVYKQACRIVFECAACAAQGEHKRS